MTLELRRFCCLFFLVLLHLGGLLLYHDNNCVNQRIYRHSPLIIFDTILKQSLKLSDVGVVEIIASLNSINDSHESFFVHWSVISAFISASKIGLKNIYRSIPIGVFNDQVFSLTIIRYLSYQRTFRLLIDIGIIRIGFRLFLLFDFVVIIVLVVHCLFLRQPLCIIVIILFLSLLEHVLEIFVCFLDHVAIMADICRGHMTHVHGISFVVLFNHSI